MKPELTVCVHCGTELVELDTIVTSLRVSIERKSWWRLWGDVLKEGWNTYRKSEGHKIHKCKPNPKKSKEPTERMKGMLRENPPSQ